jgi:hypothetical protein
MSAGHESEDGDLRERLRRLRVDPPDGGFEATLRRRLLEAGPPAEPSPWRRLRAALGRRPGIAWPALGLAAGLAAFVVLWSVAGGPGSLRTAADRTAAATVLPATKVAVVRLNLSADVDVDGAAIRVQLPPELAFWVDGQALPDRVFEWVQPLRSGDNEIPIAVRGQRPGRYRIAVVAQIGRERVEHDVVLEVVDG